MGVLNSGNTTIDSKTICVIRNECNLPDNRHNYVTITLITCIICSQFLIKELKR
jgi:hypothetical protein